MVVGGGSGECKVLPSEAVNPLGLSLRPSENRMMAEALMEDPGLMKYANKSRTFALQYRQKESTFEKQANESATLNRVKRDRSMIIRADKLVDGDGKKTNIVTMVKLKFCKI